MSLSKVVSWASELLAENKRPLLFAASVGLIWYIWDGFNLLKAMKDLSVTTEAPLDYEYDYIVVGGGTSGCLLASRLATAHLFHKDADGKSFRPFKVLLVEKNVPDVTDVDDPYSLWVLLHSHKPHYSLPLPALKDRKIAFQTSKRFGGSGLLRPDIVMHGHSSDFDNWSASGWSYSELKPFFSKFEDRDSSTPVPWGKMGITKVTNETEVARKFVEAILKTRTFSQPLSSSSSSSLSLSSSGGAEKKEEEEQNIAQIEEEIVTEFEDLRVPLEQFHKGESGWGASLSSVNVDLVGDRSSVLRQCLIPTFLHFPNLHVRSNILATELMIRDNVVKGVTMIDGSNKSTVQVRAKHEVILTCGPIETPKLLMLSGIGPQKHLEKKGIKVKVPLEGVGRNLRDSLVVPLSFSTQDPCHSADGMYQDTKEAKEMAKPSSPWEAIAYDDHAAENGAPKVQLALYSGLLNEYLFRVLYSDFSDLVFPEKYGRGHGYTLFTSLLHPKSSGRVKLASSKAKDEVVVKASHFEDEEDIHTLSLAVQKVKALATGDFLGHVTDKQAPHPLFHEIPETEEEWDRFVRATVLPGQNFVGTCKMGDDELSVVDKDLKVKGVSGLRIADSSVIPSTISGPKFSATLAVAEKACEIVVKSFIGRFLTTPSSPSSSSSSQ